VVSSHSAAPLRPPFPSTQPAAPFPASVSTQIPASQWNGRPPAPPSSPPVSPTQCPRTQRVPAGQAPHVSPPPVELEPPWIAADEQHAPRAVNANLAAVSPDTLLE
jgi:hypothetical protein